MEEMTTILTDNEEVMEAAMDAAISEVPKAKGCLGKTLIGTGFGFIAGVVTCKVVIPMIKKAKERKAKYIQVVDGEQQPEADVEVEVSVEDLDEE